MLVSLIQGQWGGGVATNPLPLVRPRVNTNYVQCYHGRFPIRIMAAADLQTTRK